MQASGQENAPEYELPPGLRNMDDKDGDDTPSDDKPDGGSPRPAVV